jgi:hypothetical protein
MIYNHVLLIFVFFACQKELLQGLVLPYCQLFGIFVHHDSLPFEEVIFAVAW